MSAALVDRLRWQQPLFAAEPERGALLRLEATWELIPRRVRVHRNHAVEHALRMARPYLEYAGIAPEWVVGDYDDSLALALDGPADAEVVWLDYERFGDRLGPEEVARWLAGRIAALREQSGAPIVVVDWDGPRADAAAFGARLEAELAGMRDVLVGDRSEVFAKLDDGAFDPGRARITGTRLSAAAITLTGRLLGARWLAAVLGSRPRAVVVDLDNTLHRGVLGEDGVGGVEVTDGHRRLQRRLVEIHERGLFLGLLSRNEESDVRSLFTDRGDLEIGWDTFDAHSVTWGAKSDGIHAIARELRIDPGTMLFVDDNLGELVEVVQRFPALHAVQAMESAEETARALEWYPGLWAPATTETDALRSADLRANRERERILNRSQGADGAYYRELGVTLTVSHDEPDELPRIAELATKTNQFNLAMTRLDHEQLEARLRDDSSQVGAIRLEDRLTDSGLIGMAAARRDGDALHVEELCISCRALGRRLETQMVAQLVAAGPLFSGTREVVFTFADGPRNRPAREWLEAFAGRDLPPAPEPTTVSVEADTVARALSNPDVEVRRRGR